jgi:hypothetical protein
VTPSQGTIVAEEDPHAKEHRDVVMQRVRVGITGLAAVFLLTLLAAAVLSFFGAGEQHTTRLANGVVVTNTAAGNEDVPREPLAELGVAPGGNTPKQAAPTPGQAKPPAPAPVAAPGGTEPLATPPLQHH